MNLPAAEVPDAVPASAVGERLILLTRYPVAGRSKTRMIPVLGGEGAARLQRRLTLRALRAAEGVQSRRGVELEVQFEGADLSTMEHWLGEGLNLSAQPNGDLGQKMDHAFDKAFREGARSTVLIGADCPELSAELLAEAFERLRERPVVLGPAEDGGYYLVGLREPVRQLFAGVNWGSHTVLAETLSILERLGKKPSLLRPLADLDRPADLALWQRILAREEADLGRISVIIPALNEEASVGRTIESAFSGGPAEVLLADGGSTDRTAELARSAGARVLKIRPGRARQMNAGAFKASGNILLFLHADTVLPPDYGPLLSGCLSDSRNAAGAFGFAIEDRFPCRRVVEWSTNLRSRWFQLPYGDQALFLRRSLFEELGGFSDLPILEDYDLVTRLRRCGRVVTLPQRVRASGRRWKRLGFWRATLINKRVLLGHRLGIPPERLAGLYRASGVAEK